MYGKMYGDLYTHWDRENAAGNHTTRVDTEDSESKDGLRRFSSSNRIQLFWEMRNN